VDIQNKKDFGVYQNDLLLILDLIEDPCLLINSGSNTILTANVHFNHLTRFGTTDIVGTKVSHLIPNFDFQEFFEGSKESSQIITKSGKSIVCEIEIIHLNKKNNISLLKISPDSGLYWDGEREIFRRMLTVLEKIGWGVHAQEQSALFETIASEVSNLFSAETVIYLHDNVESTLRRIIKSDVFPVTFHEIELDRYSQNDFWSIGKRVITEFHRIARSKKLAALATIPIGEPITGFLLIALGNRNFSSQEKNAFDEIKRWLSLFAKLNTKIAGLDHRISQLSINEQLNNLIVENSSDLILVLDSDLKIISANPKFLDVMGYSMYEILGHAISDFMSIKKGAIEEVFSATDTQININMINRDGIEVAGRLRAYEFGLVIKQKVLIFTDDTIIAELKENLLKAENKASLGEVLADLAHEVRNPINNISTGLQVLRREEGISEDFLEVVDRMQSDCIRMNDLMESILSYSRQSTDVYKDIDVSLLIRRILSRFDRRIKKNRISATITVDSDDCLVLGDMRALDQVFTNIINNSIDSMRTSGGEIVIKIEDFENDNSQMVITIADTGIGIPDVISAKIFQPFTTGKEKGTGLGLAITKKIIDAHGGKIFVESYTSGTIFSIRLSKAEKIQ